MSELRLQGVTRRYGAKTAVTDVSLVLRPGRITALLGPSGSGKTTLMRLIAGLEAPDEGEVRLGDEVLSGAGAHVPPEKRGVGLVFQDYALFPHMTVLDNVGFGLSGQPRSAREARSRTLLEQVGLADRAGAWPHALSGGEQQRVALVRALAREPEVLLLDEPFSGLDRHLRTGVRDFLFPALRASGAAVAVVTHDVDEALLLADDLVLLANGRVVQTGTPSDCYRHPVSLQAARLLGDITVLDGEARGGEVITAFGRIPAPEQADGKVQVALRPEGLRPDADGLPTRITMIRFAGGAMDYYLERDRQHVVVRASEGLGAVGGDLRISLDPAAAHVFAA
jgi:iron(III) transport system ATP-binding protein